MALLDDISRARQDLDTRIRKQQANGGRVGGDDWASRWVTSDMDSMQQLGLLESTINDPRWTASIDREVEARRTSQNANLNEEYRQGTSQARAGAAATGRAGGSWDTVGKAQQDQRLAAARAQVSQQLTELKAAGVRNLDEMGRQLLDSVLAGADDQAAMSTSLSGQQAGIATQQQMAQNEAQYRGLLANTIAGFAQSAIPAISMGFTAADRWNSANRENYRDYRDTGGTMGWGEYQRMSPNRSWWGIEQ